jgi:ornithine carbamoyltransferase
MTLANKSQTKPYAGNPLAGRDLLRLLDLSPEEFKLVLDTASEQKAAWLAGDFSKPYPEKAVAIILEKPSMRTRNSFELGVARLGATPLVMSDKNSAFSRGETIQDTTLVLERFADAIVIRTFEQSKLEEVAHWASVPVVNALTDDFHPCQILADLLTVREHFGKLEGLTLAYVGDGNNIANSLLEGGALTGMEIRIATPEGYGVSAELLAECKELAASTGAKLFTLTNVYDALDGADVVVTDTWASMGAEEELPERMRIFEPYKIDLAKFETAKPEAVFLHCLPAHRGQEVTDEVMDHARSLIYDEAENRLHAQKALLSLLMAAS